MPLPRSSLESEPMTEQVLPMAAKDTAQSKTAPAADRSGIVLLAPSLVFMTLVGLFPLLHSIFISFTGYSATNSFVYQFVGVANYANGLYDPQLWHSLLLTTTFTVVSVVASLVLAIALALLFNMDLPGFFLLRTVVLVPMLVTPIAVGIVWRVLMNPQQGLLNYLLSLIGVGPWVWVNGSSTAFVSVLLVDIWQWTPFVFIIVLAGLRALPKSPFEAAAVDGASPWEILRLITLPMLKPVITIAVLLRLIDAARTYDTVYLLTRGGPNFATDLSSIYLQRVNFQFFNFGYGAALSWIYLILLSVAVLLYVRWSGFLKVISDSQNSR